jgi:hypothetical protein
LLIHTECCYAFVVCEAIEYLHHKQGGNRVLLSPQDLYNNQAYNPNAIVQDHGQHLNQTLNWIIYNGCVLEASCPYTGILQPPRPLWECDSWGIIYFGFILHFLLFIKI